MKVRRLIAASLLTGATAVGTLALAQTRKPAPRPRPQVTKVDAGAPQPASSAHGEGEPGASESQAPEPAASEAPVPAPSPDLVDGGRGSPLNPAAEEMPGSAGDAGAPVDYDRLLADIAALRARVAALGDNLYQSKIAIALKTEGDHGKIARLTVSLDDGVVYTAPASFAASDPTTVFEHAVAPGRHAVTVDVERKDDREDSFRTAQRSRFIVDVLRDHRLGVEVQIIDDSSMAKDFPGDKVGRYDLRVRLRAVAKPVSSK